jgi:hypothetical protein
MTFVFISLIVAGLLVFLSQASYAWIAGEMHGHRDQMTIPRLRPLQKRADLIHCIHHSVHAVCGLQAMIIAYALVRPAAGIPVIWISVSACMMLTVDAAVYLVNERRHDLSGVRDAIQRKWKSEKVFGPEHDNEVSLFRTLKELTTRNLGRDIVHALVIVLLGGISL